MKNILNSSLAEKRMLMRKKIFTYVVRRNSDFFSGGMIGLQLERAEYAKLGIRPFYSLSKTGMGGDKYCFFGYKFGPGETLSQLADRIIVW